MNDRPLFVVTSDEFVFPKHTVFIVDYEYGVDYDNFHVIDSRGNSRPMANLNREDFCNLEDFLTTDEDVCLFIEDQVWKFGELNSEDSNDVVSKPSHYQLFPEYNIQVKDINRRLLDNIEESGFSITLDEAGWYQQAMQYFQRFYAKNGVEDIEKGIEAMQIVLNSMKSR